MPGKALIEYIPEYFRELFPNFARICSASSVFSSGTSFSAAFEAHCAERKRNEWPR